MEKIDYLRTDLINELNKQTPESKTTVVAVRYNGGVVAAADSQATMGGSFIWSLEARKALEVFENGYFLISGSMGHGHLMIREYKRYLLRLEDAGIKVVNEAHTFVDFCQQVMSSNPIQIHGIFCYSSNGRTAIYEIFPGGEVLRSPSYVSCGSGMLSAYPVLDSGWSANLSFEEAQTLAFKAVSVATQRDPFSGGTLKTYVLEGTEDDLRTEDIWSTHN